MPTQTTINKGTLTLLAANATDAAPSTKNLYFAFQYNPEKLLHTFNPQADTGNAQCPVSEFFNLTFELDSLEIDALPQSPPASQFGLHPALAMLESMMQPQEGGSQTALPVVIFRWGEKRSVPVYVVGLSVEEKSFDLTLNPTRAAVTLTLRALSNTEVNSNKAAGKVFQAHLNDRKSLIDIYKSQTGQTPATITTTVAAATGVGTKPKTSA